MAYPHTRVKKHVQKVGRTLVFTFYVGTGGGARRIQAGTLPAPADMIQTPRWRAVLWRRSRILAYRAKLGFGPAAWKRSFSKRSAQG